jgi:hypothetical protein
VGGNLHRRGSFPRNSGSIGEASRNALSGNSRAPASASSALSPFARYSGTSRTMTRARRRFGKAPQSRYHYDDVVRQGDTLMTKSHSVEFFKLLAVRRPGGERLFQQC